MDYALNKKKPQAILIVDDEPDILQLLGERLRAHAYTVLAARNGKECLALAESEKPDLIILDILMPEMDGFEVLRKLKNNHETSDIPVLMLTAKGETRSLIDARSMGCADYIIKPFDPKELLRLVNRYI